MRKRTSDESRPGVSSRSCSDRHSIAPDRRYPQGLPDSQFAGMAIGDRCLPVLARSSRRSSADVVRWAYRSPVCCSTRPLRARSALRRASRRSDLGSSHRSIRRPRRQRGVCRLDEFGRQRRPSRKSGARTAKLRTLLDIFHFNPKLALHGPLWLNFVNVDDSLGVFAFLHLSCFFRGHATAGPLTARLSNPTSVGP